MEGLLSNDYQGIYRDRKGMELERINKHQLITQTADGLGTRINKIHYNRIIRNIERQGNTATVTLILRESVHKMQLLKARDNWQISRDVYADKVHG